MEPESSLPHSQQPATCLYSEPDQSNPCPHPTSWISILILSSHLRLDPPRGSFPQISPSKSCMYLSPIRSICPAHHILLDLITRIIFRPEYRVIKNDCRGFNSLSYTIHLGQEYIVVPMNQEILKVFFYDVRCAVVMHFFAWSAVC